MNISILTVFSELYDTFLQTSLIGRAQDKGIVKINASSFFKYVAPKERIDAPVIGHGSGMVIRPDVIEAAVNDKENQFGPAFKIFFSPQGRKLNQPLLQELADKLKTVNHLMLIPSRYEGMDDRVEQVYADEIISVGDFVVMGGDVPAMLFLEGLLRLMPGVVGKQESIEEESFSGPFVDFPVYAPPAVWKDRQVPDILKSGNHGAIKAWRMDKAVEKTVVSHFDWLRSYPLTDEQIKISKRYIPTHYVTLQHGDVLVGDSGGSRPGATSVTSIDIHDIARSSKTYGVEQFFIVTPLIDQQKIVRTMLDFWQTGVGIEYNPQRHSAVNGVNLQANIDDVIAAIEAKEGVRPLLIATSARVTPQADRHITFFDQEKIFRLKRPVLLIFGTGKGLTDELLARCDYVLVPVRGFSEFNHLSVRSAVAIILDRWMGINEKNC
jgi:tRNA (guanine37-N1)-methyltransferase